MSLQVPVHQFEIRFSYLLNFSKIAGEILSPFIPQATNLQIENAETSQYAKYTLHFAKEFFMIIVSWDRVIFRYERNPKSVAVNNSILEEPFLNLFLKLKEHPEFGKVKNFLLYTIYINQTGKTKEEIVSEFINSNLNKSSIEKILSSPSDVSIIINKVHENRQMHISFGPYLGADDLANRKALPVFEKEIADINIFGEMAEVKIYENTDNVTFSKYKEVIKQSEEIIGNLWKKL